MALHAGAEELARPRVLVVDDEVCVARLLADSLERDGLEVRTCHDGRSALEVAVEWQAEVVLLDARMPGMDGYEVCRRLRALGFTTPILIWSGYDSVSDIVLAHDAGADDHVSKNANVAVVRAKIRRAVERARSHAQRVPASPTAGGAPDGGGIHPPQLSGIRDLLATAGVGAPEIDRAGLTRLEEHIYSRLACAVGVTVWTSSLFEEGWGQTSVSPGSLYRAISSLWRKLEPCGWRIWNVRGVGYRLERSQHGDTCAQAVAGRPAKLTKW